MGFVAIPFDTGSHHGFCQYGLPIGQSGQGYRVERAEGVEGIALDAGSFHRSIEKTKIEKGIVSD